MPEKKKKLCFVIAPIGSEGSDTRHRSNQILNHIIKPVAKDCGYDDVIRADDISKPGMITNDIIQYLVDADLVVADLTDHNANVFYELALRHALRTPIVQLIAAGQAIPFDVAPSRTVQVDHHDLDSVAQCKDQLAAQIRAVEEDPSNVDNPISIALDLQALKKSDKPLEQTMAAILAQVQNLATQVGSLTRASRQEYDRQLPAYFRTVEQELAAMDAQRVSDQLRESERIRQELQIQSERARSLIDAEDKAIRQAHENHAKLGLKESGSSEGRP